MKMLSVTDKSGELFCINPHYIATIRPLQNNEPAKTLVEVAIVEGADNLACEYYVQESTEQLLDQLDN